MSKLEDIATRHGHDRWKDALFVGVAALLTALSIGSATSNAVGKASDHQQWDITVIESPPVLLDTPR